VALGGGQIISHHDLLGFAARDGASRLLTAVELVRLGKAKTLVLGGSWPIPGKPGVPSMSVVQDWIVSWGCILQPGDQGRSGGETVGQSGGGTVGQSGGGTVGRFDGATIGVVTNLGICIDTHDEAVAFRKLKESQGWHKVILVTSALHMRRSEALFRKQGVEVLPVAADFESYGVPQEYAFSPFPGQHRFSLLARYLHEKIGWWVYRWRGWV
jgi:hypothetical protein